MVPLFLIASVFLPAHVPDDVGYISIALFGIVLLGLFLLPRLAPYFVRGGLYMGSTFLLYVSDASWMKAVAPIPMTYHILFGAMAVMVLLCMRFDSQSRFQTTPLDYLMVCLAVIFPFLPEVQHGYVGVRSLCGQTDRVVLLVRVAVARLLGSCEATRTGIPLGLVRVGDSDVAVGEG